ncbi:MAG: hypothetical protein CMJ39_02245 [Phycisphaerae bacterium]|nr:hypothetical protein [Phycisphaerae bacterium]|tara:strand:- start:733 stop:1176 length:444 start_codon:yes stop_codon:yes gene_type:complete
MRIRFILILLPLLMLGCNNSTGELFAIKPAWTMKMSGLTHYSLGNGLQIWVQESPIVTATDIKTARFVTDDLGNPAVRITLDPRGAERMSRFTEGHVSQPLAVFVDEALISAPVVTGQIGPDFLVMGLGDKSHAESFAERVGEMDLE